MRWLICFFCVFQYLPLWICTAMILQLCVCVLPEDEENVLHIGGIFPIAGEGGWQGGQACMPAANLALTDVNNRADLLPGFTLRLHSNDSEVPNITQLFTPEIRNSQFPILCSPFYRAFAPPRPHRSLHGQCTYIRTYSLFRYYGLYFRECYGLRLYYSELGE